MTVEGDAPGQWLWVTGPRYYAELDGSDRVDLEPVGEYVPDGWWTCHKETREGDLVMLYRTKPRMDIAYLIQARSDAYSLLQDPTAEPGWNYGCDYEVIEKFENPMGIAEIKADPVLEGWNAKNAKFQHSAFRMQREIWDHLISRLVTNPEETARELTKLTKIYSLEKEIEDTLAQDPERFAAVGLNLQLVERQHRCLNGGRADLVGKYKHSNRYVVIELKRGLVGRSAVAQVLSYQASIGTQFKAGGGAPPHGVLVGERLDNEAAGMISDDDRLRFVSLSELGFEPIRA